MRIAYVGKNMKKSAERRGLNPIENSSATVVVDVANVMGARADGWWRDRAGAALRLCREVMALASRYTVPPEASRRQRRQRRQGVRAVRRTPRGSLGAGA